MNQLLAQVEQMNREVDNIDSLISDMKEKINGIPDIFDREYTALQIAEALRLIVGDSRPGGFSGTWSNTFRSKPAISAKDFPSEWCHYISLHSYRFNFIMEIAQGSSAYNNSFWTKYLLKEYEYCQSGKNTHRNSNFEIEHFFPSAWADKNPHLLTGCGFNSPEQYKTNFIEQLGNKLILDSGLNRALKDEDVKIRTGAYKSQSYGRVNVSATNPSQSAINIGIDLDQKNCSHCRVYVQLRSLCLAIFAAKRF